MASIRNRLSQTPKATSYGPEPQTSPYAPDRTQIRDGSFGQWQAGIKNSGHAKARPFRCAGAPGRPDRSDGGIRKRTRTIGQPDRKIRDWNDFVRLGGTIVLDSDHIVCSPLTELIAKNS